MTYYEDVQRWDEALRIDVDQATRIRVMREEWAELHDALASGDRAEIAREIADVVWTALGLAHHFALPFDAVWAEVRESNMRKKAPDGAVSIRSDGKILKPPGWAPPDIEGVLR